MLSLHSNNQPDSSGIEFFNRKKLLLLLILGGMALLCGRAIDLQILNRKYLQAQGDIRQVGIAKVPAYRGKILDRYGAPLAISSPVQSVAVNPQQFKHADEVKLQKMVKLLGVNEKKLQKLLNPAPEKRFAYIKRQVNPDIAREVKALHLPGVSFKRKFKRYYPAGEVSGHLLGFTNIDDIGQEGMELAYENVLKGVSGSKRVIRDGKRRIIADVASIRAPAAGQDIMLSIDQRLQYLAYRELKAAVKKHRAQSASLVVLDAKTGDILAVVNQPSFNPNTRKNLTAARYRNRAVTDVFEPGSTIKPFVIACALEGGFVNPDAQIETHGWFRVGRNVVKDVHNYGTLRLTDVLKKSSNVAVSKIALQMPAQEFWGCYNKLGFGTSAGVSFPGEANGSLQNYRQWRIFEQATLSFGYGISTSVLQLARAYTALADDGILHYVSLLKRDKDTDAVRVMSAATAKRVRTMLEQVVTRQGTAYRARVDGYRVAGKTGTVKKASPGGYSKDKYLAVFVGMAPANDPRLVIAVMIDEPSAGDYYGGIVAAPVFSKVMSGALRVLGIAPDQEETVPLLLVSRDD
jgi:cell division protein FtsI (penicillin-binding protein 3)